MVATLFDQVRDILREGAAVVAAAEHRDAIESGLARMEQPLQVAIAGRLKAGKSTLLNAWVGERVAATDAGECTRIVTWYRDGHRYAAHAVTRTGERAPLRISNDERLVIELDDWSADQVDRLEVTWPTAQLRQLTLIDTPGLASLSLDVAERSREFLIPGTNEQPSGADAVIYLMRHLHEDDLDFLEAFGDGGVTGQSAVNGLAVLSRADEIGGCTLDSMQVAERVADRWRADARLRRLCQTVVPVAGLVAEAGATLRESEYQALRMMASVPPAELEELVLSVDRFANRPVNAPVNGQTRLELLRRFGLYGVRLACDLIRRDVARSSPAMASALVEASGLDRLRSTLTGQFELRSRVLKARTGLLLAEHVLRADGSPAALKLLRAAQQLALSAHDFVEIAVLNRIRTGLVSLADLGEHNAADLERVLGGAGAAPAERLGFPPDAPRDALRAAAEDKARAFRRLAANPIVMRDVDQVLQCAIRTCEGLVTQLAI